MKKINLKTTAFLALAVLFSACGSTSDDYKELLEKEKSSIDNYIKRNNIKVIDQLPDGDWAADEYYRTADGLYIHIVSKGDQTTEVQDRQQVLVRYYQITLDVPPDTLVRVWDDMAAYPNPAPYYYNVSVSDFPAFNEAFGIMKYNYSVAKIIVPSKLGTGSDRDAVVPYLYDLKIQLGD